jgi:(R,R)-butanediol dehydrogenase / meso-butanediol dehydrogenase / diacetyl reductase
VRAVAVAEDRRLVMVDHEPAPPGPGQALLEVAFCGICGSDLHFRDVPALFPAGTIPGHELSGRVAALGPDVADWQLGDRVCVLPFAQCGECERCRAGEEQVCARAIPEGVGLGTGRAGGYAEQVLVDARMLFALPAAVDDRAGALVEPLAVAVRAVTLAAPAPGDPLLVVGGGAIGLLTALVLAARGHEQVTLVSRNAERAKLAASLGLAAVSLADAEGDLAGRYACVFECAGSPSAASLAVAACRPLGTVMLVGIAMAPLELAAAPIVLAELTIRGVLAYRRAEFAAAIELLASGAIGVEALVTATIALEGSEAAFQALAAPGSPHLKILLDPARAA